MTIIFVVVHSVFYGDTIHSYCSYNGEREVSGRQDSLSLMSLLSPLILCVISLLVVPLYVSLAILLFLLRVSATQALISLSVKEEGGGGG